MKAHALLKKTAATLGAGVLAFVVGCSTHRAVDTTAQTTGEIRTEASAQNQATPGQTLGTAPAPANTQGAVTTSTPAVISGPAVVDKQGNLYTSSSAGSAGNASGTGLNTNVNIKAPAPASTSNVVVTQQPATTVVETTPAPVVVETPAPTPVVVETPAPAPVVVETPAPAPVVTETVPMASSTTETTTQTKHKRMRKD